jgi:division protein CdvB (Snf7/Vps24/ESCRT-III family)
MSQYGWGSGRQPTIGDKIKSMFKNDHEPLDKKAIIALYRVKGSISRINAYIEKLKDKDREYFQEVVDSQISRDERRAKIYAKEVAAVRKVMKQLYQVQYMLQQVALKLETFLIFHNATGEIKPVLAIMNQAVGILRESAPADLWIEIMSAARELEATMDTSVVDVSVGTDVALDTEAKKVYEEAKIVAEQKLKERYAELPSLVGEGEAEKSGEAST